MRLAWHAVVGVFDCANLAEKDMKIVYILSVFLKYKSPYVVLDDDLRSHGKICCFNCLAIF